MPPEIIIIAAIAEKNRVIGIENKLPWHISEDLKRFKALTFGHPVLMGRKTFDSILARNGKPLPGRRNLVLSKSKTYPNLQDVETFASMEDALAACQNEQQVAVIGGESLFKAGFKIADRMELTLVEDHYKGDAFFPEYVEVLKKNFKLKHCEPHKGFRFETYLSLYWVCETIQ